MLGSTYPPCLHLKDVKLPDFHGKPSTLADIQAQVLPYLKLVLTAREYEVANQWMEQMQIDSRMQQYSPTIYQLHSRLRRIRAFATPLNAAREWASSYAQVRTLLKASHKRDSILR